MSPMVPAQSSASLSASPGKEIAERSIEKASERVSEKSSQGSEKTLQKRLHFLIPLAVLLLAAAVGIRYWLPRPDNTTIQLSGRIESYESDLGAKVGGRVETVAVREGELVTEGQIIATLDDAALQAKLAAAKAEVGAATQDVTQAKLQIEIVDAQLQEGQLSSQQSEGDTVGRVAQAQATVATATAQLASAQAQLQQAESALALARSDRDRFSTLVDRGAISRQQYDQIQTTFETAQDIYAVQEAAVSAAQQQVSATEGALTQSQTTQLNPAIQVSQNTRTQKQQAQAQAQLAAAEANLARAQAAQSEIEAQLNDLAIKSPIDGVVLTRTVEPGRTR